MLQKQQLRLSCIRKTWNADFDSWIDEVSFDLLLFTLLLFLFSLVCGLFFSVECYFTQTCSFSGLLTSLSVISLLGTLVFLTYHHKESVSWKKYLNMIWTWSFCSLLICGYKVDRIVWTSHSRLQKLMQDLSLPPENFPVWKMPTKLHEVQSHLDKLDKQHYELLSNLPRVIKFSIPGIPLVLQLLICEYSNDYVDNSFTPRIIPFVELLPN